VMSRKGTRETHKVGDQFVTGEETPPNVCSRALHSLFLFAQVLLYGGSLPWEQDPNKATIACPDPENAVMFELRCTSP
ncbi:MAG: TIGR04076 family protein, partial [Dehalococcoidia bacterium]|nr:TIGR04076 family protein [Dehalococcoidia bacterium]